jgi:hypothetical protein
VRYLEVDVFGGAGESYPIRGAIDPRVSACGERSWHQMRHPNSHDDPSPKRRPASYRGPPVVLGHIRPHGVRRFLIYCSTGHSHHSALVEVDRWPDDAVLLDLGRRAVCTKCGMTGADVRPNWSERPPPESLTGAQWR